MLQKLTPALWHNSRRLTSAPCSTLIKRCIANHLDVYEPNYLDSLKPKYPQYEKINVALKGFDFPILESYQRYLHNIAEFMEIDVADCYALPPQEMNVQRLKPNSTVVESEYKLREYERNLEFLNVDAPILPLFIRIAQAAIPEGVTLKVQEHSEDCDERRYIPDRDLLDLKSELDRMGGSKESKKK